MNFLHADVVLLCFLLMLRMGLLQLCATGVKWHPARAQQRQLGVYLLLGCQSVRQSVWLSLRSALFVCLPGCLLSADIIWGHAYPNVCRIFTAIVSNFMAEVVVNFVRAV